MSEAGRLVLTGLGLLTLLTLLGIGPTALCLRSVPGQLALAPVVGFALGGAILTTAALVMPMRTAAWALVIPAAVLSAATAWVHRGSRVREELKESSVPLGFSLVGVLLGILPGLIKGTAGPYSLANTDVWFYVANSLWLRDHASTDSLPAAAGRYDLTSVVGQSWAAGWDTRIGADVLNAAGSALFRMGPELTIMPFFAVVYALVPAGLWVVARALGAGRVAAAVAAAFGLSPAVLMLVGDGNLGNLSGLALAGPALLFLIRGVADGRRGDIALAACLSGGLVAVYPEFVPMTILVVALGGVAVLARRAVAGALTRTWLQLVAVRLALILAGVLLLAPHATARMLAGAVTVGSDGPVSLQLPPRYLTLANVGGWAFGIVHLYELPWLDQLSEGRIVLSQGLPVVLGGVLILGAVRASPRNLVIVLAPLFVAIVVGAAAHERYAEGHCEYCRWKALTFGLPFLAVGVALGVDRLLRWARGRSVPILVGVLVALSSGALALANAKVIKAAHATDMFAIPAFRELRTAVSSLPTPASVLVEGADATWLDPTFVTSATYYEIRGLDGVRPFLDVERPATQQLAPVRWPEAVGVANPRQLYSPDYKFVLSPFAGVRSRRALLAGEGLVWLFRRAPIDIVISRTRWVIDPDSEAAEAVPWIDRPFLMRISSPRAQRIALRLGLLQPKKDFSTVTLARAGRPLQVTYSVDRSKLCADLRVRSGETVVEVEPQLRTPPPSAGRPNFETAYSDRPKVLGIGAIEATAGTCRK